MHMLAGRRSQPAVKKK